MSFKGTRFEKLANSIKNEISRKRKGFSKSLEQEQEHSNNTKKQKVQVAKSTANNVSGTSVPKSNSKDELKPVVGKRISADAASNNFPPPEGSQQYINDRTVYVQGLPFSATEQDIKNFFKDAGDVLSIRLPKWHDSGKLKGYGHVEFKKSEGAAKALELNGQYMQDRYLTIDRPQVPRSLVAPMPYQPSEKPAGCRTIFIKNLPYETSEEEITKHFMVYGPIKNVRLAVWNHTGKLKGIGYVDFKREDSAETAVKKSGSIVLKDRKIVVDFETGAPKGSYKKLETK
jgi:RNA recognition motif-containing protein